MTQPITLFSIAHIKLLDKYYALMELYQTILQQYYYPQYFPSKLTFRNYFAKVHDEDSCTKRGQLYDVRTLRNVLDENEYKINHYILNKASKDGNQQAAIQLKQLKAQNTTLIQEIKYRQHVPNATSFTDYAYQQINEFDSAINRKFREYIYNFKLDYIIASLNDETLTGFTLNDAQIKADIITAVTDNDELDDKTANEQYLLRQIKAIERLKDFHNYLINDY